jgi:hypothetical protein
MRHSLSNDPLRRSPDALGPVEDDRSLGVDHAAQGTHCRGLAGTVRTEQHDDLALAHLEVEAVQH